MPLLVSAWVTSEMLGHVDAEGGFRVSVGHEVWRMLDDVFAQHPEDAAAALGAPTATATLQEWLRHGLEPTAARRIAAALRKAAFHADHLGTASVRLTPDPAPTLTPPGVATTFAAVLELLAAACGDGGTVRFAEGAA